MERVLISAKIDKDVKEALVKYAKENHQRNQTLAINEILKKRLKVKR